jgi:hypothetical protein
VAQAFMTGWRHQHEYDRSPFNSAQGFIRAHINAQGAELFDPRQRLRSLTGVVGDSLERDPDEEGRVELKEAHTATMNAGQVRLNPTMESATCGYPQDEEHN